MTDKQLLFKAAYDMGDNLIAIDAFGTGIFQINKSDMSTHLLAKVDGIGRRRNVYQSVEQYNGEVFFFPSDLNMASLIIVYHLKDRYIEYIDLQKIHNAVSGRYEPIYRLEDSVLLFPTELERDVLRFRLDTRKIDVVPQWREVTKNIVLNYKDSFVKLADLVEFQDTLYHTVKGTNFIIGINKGNHSVKCYTVPTDRAFYTRLDYDGEKFWIAEWNNQGVISWNPITQKTQYYSLPIPENVLQGNKWINYILCGTKYLWIVPQRYGKIIKMSYETGKSEYIDIFPDEFRMREGNNVIFGMLIRNGDIVDLYPFFSNLVIHLDLKNDVLLEKYERIFLPVKWSEEELVDYQVCHEMETNRISSNEYLDFLLQSVKKRKENANNDSSGENIWKYIKASDS